MGLTKDPEDSLDGQKPFGQPSAVTVAPTVKKGFH